MPLNEFAELLRLSVDDFVVHALTLSSPHELSLYVARQLMRHYAPSLLWITLHDMDIAHSGSYSLYIEAIQRTDRLCSEIWRTIQSEAEYAGNTTLFILPDFGRDSDLDAGGNGFQHHRTGDALSRTTWLMAIAPGIRENTVVDRPVDPMDLVPTRHPVRLHSAGRPGQAPARTSVATMSPTQIATVHFKDYPPEAKRVATSHIRLWQQLPPAFVPVWRKYYSCGVPVVLE